MFPDETKSVSSGRHFKKKFCTHRLLPTLKKLLFLHTFFLSSPLKKLLKIIYL